MDNNRPYYPGSNLQQVPQFMSMDYYVYELDFSALANGTSSSGSFIIQADSWFLWTQGAVFADVAAAGQLASTLVVPLVTVLITDTGSGRQLMNTAVPVSSMFGTGALPYVLPRQRAFMPNSTVSVQVNNFDAAQAYNLRLSFIGEKGFTR